MKANKSTVLSLLAQRCRNIMASNWQAQLNTIKGGSKESQEEIHRSKVKYIMRKGKPYIWVPEDDMHNMNVMFDERSSLAIASPYPGALGNLLRLLNKLPARVALTGDVVPLSDEKAELASKSLKEIILSEERVIKGSTHTVSGLLGSSDHVLTSHGDNLRDLLDAAERYNVYKFNVSSCMLIDGHGMKHEVDLIDLEKSKADPIAFFSAKLIDGINRSEVRRRALILFCLVHMNANVRDAVLLSVDGKGFDVLGKVPCSAVQDGASDYQWKEFRFVFEEEAHDINMFCQRLVEMEEDVINRVSKYSGLA